VRFLIDESADARLAIYLRALGHDVTVIAQDYPTSLKDPEILRIAVGEERILITFDRDFGELVFSHRHPHAGVLYFRLGPIDLAVEISRVDHVLATYADHLDRFLVITPTRVRVR
jgi:predicted nuclease of predicted toxin-antitoxin system